MYFRPGGRDDRKRYEYNFLVVQKYLINKCNNREIVTFFKERNFKNIAIYGASELGKCVINDLADTDIQISCIVDQAYLNYPNGCKGIKVISKKDLSNYDDIDIILVTVLYEFNDIVDALVEEGVDLDKIISITDVVYSL